MKKTYVSSYHFRQEKSPPFSAAGEHATFHRRSLADPFYEYVGCKTYRLISDASKKRMLDLMNRFKTES